jgi:DNA-binding transcriptional LysR family regulator
MTDGSLTRSLNSDALRTFLAVADAGSFTGGADRIFRTQSATSLQIKQLETLLGRPVFERHGRGVRLSPAGEQLEKVARQVVGDLDRAMRAFAGTETTGRLRVGLPDEIRHGQLSRVIADFTAAHPGTEIVVQCAMSSRFSSALENGELDLAVYDAETAPPDAEILMQETTHWAASRRNTAWRRDPVPVALFDRDCWWRNEALEHLARLRRPYRIVYSSESSEGVIAALDAGIAVGMLSRGSIHDGLTILGAEDGFPEPLPNTTLVLRRAPALKDDPTADAMSDALRSAFRR